MRHIVTNTYIVISPPFNPNHKKISKTKYLLFLFWLTGWITVGLLLSSSQLQSAPLKFPKHYQNKNVFLQYFESNLGIIWYGIYLQKRKIGYLKSSARFNEKISSGCFTIETTGIVNIPSSGKKRHLEFQTIASFSAQAPYILLNYSDKVIHDNMVSHTEFTLNSKGYLANITQGGQTSHKIADIVNYSLQDYSALQWWISLQPRVGDSITYQYLSTGKLTLESNTASIDAVHEFIADGVETIYYNVTTVGPDGIGIQEVFGQDGTAYRIFLGSLFECRLESQSQAMKIDAPAELFIQNTISIDQDLGQPEKVTFLKILLKGVSETSWPAGPGQLISNDLEQNALVVTITSQKATLAAVDDEIKENLAATTDIPSDHPLIIDLAHQAIGDALTPAEKVAHLVDYVFRYIEDDYTANPLTVLDIIHKKRGDCTEHAKLFATMARSLKIPARIVGGLVYLGDDLRQFGLHAWNEVIIDGVWVPVDPTWGQTAIDATHIRFPVNLSQEWQIMGSLNDITIEVLDIGYQ